MNPKLLVDPLFSAIAGVCACLLLADARYVGAACGLYVVALPALSAAIEGRLAARRVREAGERHIRWSAS